MATFLDYYMELTGYVPGLAPPLARTLVNRAYRDIQDARPWSFQIREGNLLVPDALSTGTVTATQWSTSVQADTAAKAALNAVGVDIPLVGRQFRVGQAQVYTVSAYNSTTGVLTLDRKYAETSVAGSSYQVYKAYYDAPETGFNRWLSVVNMLEGYNLRVGYQKAFLDQWDPYRVTSDFPTCVSALRAKSDGTPVFELYPHPKVARTLVTQYVVRGGTFTADSDTLPGCLPDDLLMERAKVHAYNWAGTQGLRGQDGAQVDWRFWSGQAQATYKDLLQQASRQDDETFTQSILVPHRRRAWGPPSASFLQDHGWY